MVQHQTFVLSGDNHGKVQVRDLNNQFNMVLPEIGVVVQNQPTKVQSLAVLILPPKNEPVIFAAEERGHIQVISPSTQSIQTFGAHNDFKANVPCAIVDLHRLPDAEHRLYSVASDGMVRYWELSEQPKRNMP